MQWRLPSGRVVEKRRVALWEAVCQSPAVRQHLGVDWCERWQELDSKLAHGIGFQQADEWICLAGIQRIDN